MTIQQLNERKRELQAQLYNLATDKNKETNETLFNSLEQSHEEILKQLNEVRKEMEFLVEKQNREFWDNI